MTRSISLLVLATALLATGTSTASTPQLEKRMDAAIEVLNQFTRIPEQGIPPNMLRNAYGVAVIPNTIKAGFMFAGRFGQGVLVVRRPDGSWSNPSFISLGGGSFGFQLGAESTDIILVFKTKRSVDRIHRGKLKLGADASVSAGPWGRTASAATDGRLRSEIFSYSRSRGLFGGIALDGSVIGMDKQANAAFYQAGPGDPKIILGDDTVPTPVRARKFQETLAAIAPSLEWQQRDASRTASIDPDQAASDEGGAKTYGLEDAPPAQQGEVIF